MPRLFPTLQHHHDSVIKIQKQIVYNSYTKTQLINIMSYGHKKGSWLGRIGYESYYRGLVNRLIHENIIKWEWGKPLKIDKVEWAKYRLFNS